MRAVFPLAVAVLALIALPGAAIFAADVAGYEAEINGWLQARIGVSHHLAIGLSAAAVLALIPPLIILLYFLRLRRKPVPVPSTYLWKKSIEDLHVNRLMQWLRRNILLLLQLLAAFLLLYAVLGPRLHGRTERGQHYILLIDNSASMSATDVTPSRLDWAKAEAIKTINAAKDGDSGMVIAFNSRAQILQSYTANRDELRAAVEGIKATKNLTKIDDALALAASLANPQKSTDNLAVAPADAEPGKERTYVSTEGIPATVYLFSDGRFPKPEFALANLNLELRVPPGGSDNLGIVRLEMERGWHRLPEKDNSPDRGKVTVECNVRNHRGTAAEVNLYLTATGEDDKLLGGYSRKVTLAGGETQRVFFHLKDIPDLFTIKAALTDANDAFADDDTAWLTASPLRKASVLVISPDDNFHLRRFFSTASIQAIAAAEFQSSVTIAGDTGRFDLILYDRCAPATPDEMPEANTLFIGTPPPAWKETAPANNPVVLRVAKEHPLLENADGARELRVDEAFRFAKTPAGAKVLIEAEGNQALMLAVPRGAYTDVILTFPLLTADGRWNTRWPIENSFVIFMRNAVRLLGNVRDAGAEESTSPGDEKWLRPGTGKTVTIIKPDGNTRIFPKSLRPEFAFAETDLTGVYLAEWEGRRSRFAVNLFEQDRNDEGAIAPVDEVKIGDRTVTAGDAVSTPRELWKYALLLSLAVVLFEWWFYNRRVRL